MAVASRLGSKKSQEFAIVYTSRYPPFISKGGYQAVKTVHEGKFLVFGAGFLVRSALQRQWRVYTMANSWPFLQEIPRGTPKTPLYPPGV